MSVSSASLRSSRSINARFRRGASIRPELVRSRDAARYPRSASSTTVEGCKAPMRGHIRAIGCIQRATARFSHMRNGRDWPSRRITLMSRPSHVSTSSPCPARPAGPWADGCQAGKQLGNAGCKRGPCIGLAPSCFAIIRALHVCWVATSGQVADDPFLPAGFCSCASASSFDSELSSCALIRRVHAQELPGSEPEVERGADRERDCRPRCQRPCEPKARARRYVRSADRYLRLNGRGRGLPHRDRP
jgi:hypothetical protein